MSQEDGTAARDRLSGLSVEAAVDELVAADGTRDPGAVRRALFHVSEEGVVRESAVGPALSKLAKAVSTPETRVELSGMALADAREAAENAPDLAVVGSRLETLEARQTDVEERAVGLGGDLQALVRLADEADLYEVGAGVQRLTAEANAVQRDADELKADLEAFERWLASDATRFRELEDDASALGNALEELEAVIENLTEQVDRSTDGLDGDETDETDETDVPPPAVTWVEATLRQRLMTLLVADLRAELDGLRTWGEREGLDHEDRDAAAEADLDDLEPRCSTVGERLDDLARPAWRERHGERIAAFESALEAFEPPVTWGEVRATLERHRSEIDRRA